MITLHSTTAKEGIDLLKNVMVFLGDVFHLGGVI